MRLIIDLPAQYATAVRAELRRRGYNHDRDEVRRVLAHITSEMVRRHWWQTTGAAFYWQRQTTPEKATADD